MLGTEDPWVGLGMDADELICVVVERVVVGIVREEMFATDDATPEMAFAIAIAGGGLGVKVDPYIFLGSAWIGVDTWTLIGGGEKLEVVAAIFETLPLVTV